MSTEIVARPDIRAMTAAELRGILAQSIRLTCDELVWMAQVWQELKGRGENMTDLKSGLMRWLPDIAAHKIEPELVVRYTGSQMLIGKLATLSVTTQRRLLETGTVEIPRIDRGNVVKSVVPLEALRPEEINRLVDRTGRMRSYDEQITALDMDGEPEPPEKDTRIRIDDTGEFIVTAGIRISIDKVLRVLGSYYGIDVIKLIEAEAAIAWTTRDKFAHPGGKRDRVSTAIYSSEEGR